MSEGVARELRIERFVVELGAAFQQRAVYPSSHPQVLRAIERAVGAFDELRAAGAAAEVSLLLVEGDLLVDRQPLPEGAHWARGMKLAFARHGLGGMTLRDGLSVAELAAFLDSCASETGPAASAHLQTGQAGFLGSDPISGGFAGGHHFADRPLLARPEDVERARSELLGVASGSVARLDKLREMVARLARAAAGASFEPPQWEIRSAADAALVHGLGVALGTLRLALALGVADAHLELLGLAGLLHDVGHLEAAPGEDGATRRRLHPVRGAARLAAVEGLPDVVLLVAYEHHLRFDGAPNYPELPVPRRPVAAARVVAVADTWDTARTRGRANRDEALWLLRDRAGGYLDPDLVELFAAIVGDAPPAGS